MTDSEELIFITVMRVKIMVLDSRNSKEKRRDKKKTEKHTGRGINIYTKFIKRQTLDISSVSEWLAKLGSMAIKYDTQKLPHID